MNENKSEIIFYESSDGQMKVEVRFEGETVWLSESDFDKKLKR